MRQVFYVGVEDEATGLRMVSHHGVDHGNGSKPLLLWHLSRRYFVVKVPSGKGWKDRLNPSVSTPGYFIVCELVEFDDGRQVGEELVGRLVGDELFQMPVSKGGDFTLLFPDAVAGER